MKLLGVLSVLLIGLVGNLLAQPRLVNHPAYEFKKSGLYQIEKIESTESETKLHVRCTFIPGWWINFATSTYIKPTGTDDQLFITDMIGGSINKRITMPATGDSSVVLIFPPLPPGTQPNTSISVRTTKN